MVLPECDSSPFSSHFCNCRLTVSRDAPTIRAIRVCEYSHLNLLPLAILAPSSAATLSSSFARHVKGAPLPQKNLRQFNFHSGLSPVPPANPHPKLPKSYRNSCDLGHDGPKGHMELGGAVSFETAARFCDI